MNPHGHIYGNLYWELQIGWWDGSVVLGAHFAVTRRCDHAGLDAGFNLWRLMAEFRIYDNRHWNYEKGRPYHDGEEIFEENLEDTAKNASGAKTGAV